VREVLGILEPETAGRDIAWEIGDLPEVQGDPQPSCGGRARRDVEGVSFQVPSDRLCYAVGH
jgi:hypothetical protein